MDERALIIIVALAVICMTIAFSAFVIRILYSGARKSMKEKGVLMTSTAEALITHQRTYNNVDGYLASNKDISSSWPDIEYEFIVDGKEYNGKGPGIGAEGTKIKIFYNPNDPAMNCTVTQMDLWNGKTGKKGMIYALITIGCIIVLALLWGLVASR